MIKLSALFVLLLLLLIKCAHRNDSSLASLNGTTPSPVSSGSRRVDHREMSVTVSRDDEFHSEISLIHPIHLGSDDTELEREREIRSFVQSIPEPSSVLGILVSSVAIILFIPQKRTQK